MSGHRVSVLLPALAAALLLGACAGGAGLSDRIAGPDRVRGDADTVRVFGMSSRVEAFPLAIGHCSRFGRSAQFTGRIPGGHAFRCVAG